MAWMMSYHVFRKVTFQSVIKNSAAKSINQSYNPVMWSSSFCMSLKQEGVHMFKLIDSWDAGASTKILRFELPESMPVLSLPTPSGVKVLKEVRGTQGEVVVKEKSYSPISLPDTVGSFDLLVKSYMPAPEEGYGYCLCKLRKGEHVHMKLKPPRKIHGHHEIKNRWKHLGFISGGTGVAPFIQIIRTLLGDPSDTTQLSLLNINQTENDILMRKELDELAASSNGRFKITNCLTSPSGQWNGATGRGSVGLVKSSLPNPSLSDVMIMVCGRDGFVGTWAGETKRIHENGKKRKEQGPLTGILSDAGFDQCQVYKF
jgi:cytochrome-b5 reductase